MNVFSDSKKEPYEGFIGFISPVAEFTPKNIETQEVSKLEKNLNILASASGAAPMLGFLGTVIGMIMAFFEISNVTGAVSPQRLLPDLAAA